MTPYRTFRVCWTAMSVCRAWTLDLALWTTTRLYKKIRQFHRRGNARLTQRIRYFSRRRRHAIKPEHERMVCQWCEPYKVKQRCNATKITNVVEAYTRDRRQLITGKDKNQTWNQDCEQRQEMPSWETKWPLSRDKWWGCGIPGLCDRAIATCSKRPMQSACPHDGSDIVLSWHTGDWALRTKSDLSERQDL